MREVGAFEAKNKLAELLDAVEQGEEITITRAANPSRSWCVMTGRPTGQERSKRSNASRNYGKGSPSEKA